MKRVFIFIAGLVFPMVCAAQTPNVIGDWKGTLTVGSAELRLVLHITQGEGNTLKASMDSIDQGENGMSVSPIELKGTKLTFTLNVIPPGHYEGTVDASGTKITGTWNQTTPLPLELTRMKTPDKNASPAKPSDIDGIWAGALDTGALKLRTVLQITNTDEGLTATVQSPDQSSQTIAASSVTRNGSSIKVEVKNVDASYDAKIDQALTTMDGTWSQRGGSFPLVLKRVKNAAELERRRPQNPTKPYPYHEEDVTYGSKSSNIKLAATLTIPQGKGPFPAVLLIVGSGPHDRDEALLGHRPFLVLADYLTRKGIAVLRADKRGLAGSSGNYATATTADFATDAEAGVDYLETRPEIDHHKIGLIGHSEGGVVAPMVAARNPKVDFIVMMAGSGVRGDEIIIAQTRLIAEANGVSHEEAEKNAAKERQILTLVEQDKDEEEIEKEVRKELAGEVPDNQIDGQVQALTSPWFRYFLTYDPSTALRKVTCPVLAIWGSKDLQVPPAQNLHPVQEALTVAGNKNFDAEESPGLNHLFQTAKTGSPTEYGDIEETISPLALDKMATWILQR
jgi:fermentation-respiration switch protein FrsA (DUF1100 family)